MYFFAPGGNMDVKMEIKHQQESWHKSTLTPRNCSVTAKYSAASDSPTYSMVLMYVEFGVDLADGQSPDLVVAAE